MLFSAESLIISSSQERGGEAIGNRTRCAIPEPSFRSASVDEGFGRVCNCSRPPTQPLFHSPYPLGAGRPWFSKPDKSGVPTQWDQISESLAATLLTSFTPPSSSPNLRSIVNFVGVDDLSTPHYPCPAHGTVDKGSSAARYSTGTRLAIGFAKFACSLRHRFNKEAVELRCHSSHPEALHTPFDLEEHLLQTVNLPSTCLLRLSIPLNRALRTSSADTALETLPSAPLDPQGSVNRQRIPMSSRTR